MRLFSSAIAACCLLQSSSAAAEVRLTFDVSQPLAVMEALRTSDSRPETVSRIAAMPGTVSGIAHHNQFSADITPEAWRASFIDALGGQPRRDSYRFDLLTRQEAEIRANIDYIAADPARFSHEIVAIIAPYTPPEIEIEATTTLVAGSPGNGWVREGRSHFDIGGAQGDLNGARTVLAHETYHLVLDRLLRSPVLSEDSALGRVERILSNGLNEGMASHVARDLADTGPLSRRSLSFQQTNLRRMAANFRLMDVFLLATFHTSEVKPDDAGLIAFSGTFTEPGYYVFREMAAGIEKARGRDYLVSLLPQSPARFILAYHEVAEPDQPRLSKATLDIVRQLDAAAP